MSLNIFQLSIIINIINVIKVFSILMKDGHYKSTFL